MSEQTLESLNRQGAGSLVQDYLKLKKGETLLIICDETTREIAGYVEPEAKNSGASINTFFIDTESQAKIKNRDGFPRELLEKINDSQCILNILDAKAECTAFRKLIINVGQGFGRRIAHSPGLRTEHLGNAFQADFAEMLRWNNILTRLFYFAGKCAIITRDKQGTNYKLHLNLGGKDRMPIQSEQVMDGAWANIPGAEVFIAPIEHQAHGDIVINGSMLGHILPCDVLISFKKGKIEKWTAMDQAFQEILDDFAKKWAADSNWNSLCEFGIGLNNAFKKITGSQLLDEKMAGTCHIAIGTNKEFSGKIESEIHQDFVTLAPTIIIDGKTIMEGGHFTIDEADVYEDIDQINVLEEMYGEQKYRLSVRNMDEEEGKVFLALRDGTDQPFFLQVGNDESSRKILEVLNQLDATPEFSFSELKGKYNKAPAILSLLLKYDLIEQI